MNSTFHSIPPAVAPEAIPVLPSSEGGSKFPLSASEVAPRWTSTRAWGQHHVVLAVQITVTGMGDERERWRIGRSSFRADRGE
jgi:hypothetical protein